MIVGGMDMVKQGLELTRRPHVVIATPGRLADHLANCATEGFGRVKYLVLDEVSIAYACNLQNNKHNRCKIHGNVHGNITGAHNESHNEFALIL